MKKIYPKIENYKDSSWQNFFPFKRVFLYLCTLRDFKYVPLFWIENEHGQEQLWVHMSCTTKRIVNGSILMVEQNAQERNYMLDFRSFVWPAQKIVMRGHGLLFFISPPPRRDRKFCPNCTKNRK